MRIGIGINEILRDFIGQLEYTCNKYIDGCEMNIKETPVTSFNLTEHFPFETVKDLNSFLYREASLEIFGHADELEHNVVNELNRFIMDMKDLYNHEIVLVTREIGSAIPSTLFFLSKTSCKCENYRFVKTYEEEWDNVDVLITANPEVLKCRPNDKISVKVSTTYNENAHADYTIKSLFEFMTDDVLRNKIITTKLTNYEES